MIASASFPPLALPPLPPGERLALTTDTLLRGVHFPVPTSASDVAHKALAVNLSDLAAMGARALALDVRVHAPPAELDWRDALVERLREADAPEDAARRITAVETDAAGLTVLALGSVPAGAALRRDGARAEDDVWVSGTLGDAGGGLALVLDAAATEIRGEDGHWLRQRLDRPTPRLALGRALLDVASAAIDLSDGLCGDLGHLARASGLAATVEASRLPLSPALIRCMGEDRARTLALSAGDDYELCFSASPGRRGAILAAASASGTPVTRIGRLHAGDDVRVLDGAGRTLALGPAYQHRFAAR